MRSPVLVLLGFCLLFLPESGRAQTPKATTTKGLIYVQHITIEGLGRTKPYIVSREYTFQQGDTLPAATFQEKVERTRKNIFNTGLFRSVTIQQTPTSNDNNSTITAMALTVQVQERWYTFPFPIFELADRNFNVWWEEQNRSLNRVDYGIRMIQENLTGRNDQMKLIAHAGYTQKFELFYTLPYIDNKQRFGIKLHSHFTRNKQIALRTIDNKILFLTTPDFNRKRFRVGLSLKYRKGIYNDHEFITLYHHNQVSDSTAALYPDYFLDQRSQQQFIELSYVFKTDYRDYKYYALNGIYNRFEVVKTGVGAFGEVDMFSITNDFNVYEPLGKQFFFSGRIKGKTSYPSRQPYYNQLGLGYLQDFVRGYELYVIDGQHYGFVRTDIKYRLLNWRVDNTKVVSVKKFNNIPIDVYFKLYGDAGYVKDEHYFINNPLNNQWLYGGGAGVDIASFYDIVLRVEYSINRLLEKGLYLHFKADI